MAHWKIIETNNNACTSCGESMPKGTMSLHVGTIHASGRRRNAHMCEDCFLKAQTDYEEGA